MEKHKKVYYTLTKITTSSARVVLTIESSWAYVTVSIAQLAFNNSNLMSRKHYAKLS